MQRKWPKDVTSDEVLQWYRENKNLFPKLSVIAQAVFSMSATTIENERVFSISGKREVINYAITKL
jgi:hypothetical protein